MAIGDLNGDGNEDVFIGGAKNQSGYIYLHQGNGTLEATKQKALGNGYVLLKTPQQHF